MRYFFHLLAGDTRLDGDLGLDHVSPAAVRAEAAGAAREVIADMLRRNEPIPDDGTVEVTDARGRIVISMSLQEVVFGGARETRYRRAFAAAPHCYLLLAPDFTILDANRAYLQATMTDPSLIVRRPLFDVFPDNPGDPAADGVRNLGAALGAVLREKATQAMPVQRYDIRRRDGAWETRFWKPTNVPILDGNGEVAFILHHVQDVTAVHRTLPAATG